MRLPQTEHSNSLLRSITADDFDALAPLLEPASLDLDLDLGKANLPIDFVCFPETGVISVVAVIDGVASIEVGLVGFEGMTGLAVIMGGGQSPEETCTLVAGRGHCIESSRLLELLQRRPTLQQTLLGYGRVFATQIAQTALANGRARIEVRLARVLLMVADRIGKHEIALTHDQLSMMMGVRRPGITDAIHRLEGELMIRGRRGSLTIRDRAALEAKADGFYGVPEKEYDRVLGPLVRSAPTQAAPVASKAGSSSSLPL